MLKKIRIEERGDTEFLPGTMVDVLEFNDVNEQMVTEGKEPATGEQIMLGITKASLSSDLLEALSVLCLEQALTGCLFTAEAISERLEKYLRPSTNTTREK